MASQAIPDILVTQKTLVSTPQPPGREFSYFLSGLPTRVCGTETSSDSSNYHSCLSNPQGFLSVVGLLETASLGFAWGLLEYIKKRSVHFIGVDRRAALEGRSQEPSLQSVRQTEDRQPTHPFHRCYFPAPRYLKDCASDHLIWLSIQTRMIYTHLLCSLCILAPEKLFKLNCSLKAATFHITTTYPPEGLKPPPQLWATSFKADKPTATSCPGNQDEEGSYFNHNTPWDTGLE